ncbi:MAG TPA: winged helix-turn-helix domain-containing protein [Candidatus Acidoferrales bacterium]|nr:winged helix-turn-helix domain-containing protein [Candidatus Acidoferrales bacterium]
MGPVPRAKKAYRDDIETKAQILQVIELRGAEGCKVSYLGRFANLSHAKVKEYLAILDKLRLVDTVALGGGITVYRITDNGKKALADYKDVRNKFMLRAEGQKPSILDLDLEN